MTYTTQLYRTYFLSKPAKNTDPTLETSRELGRQGPRGTKCQLSTANLEVLNSVPPASTQQEHQISPDFKQNHETFQNFSSDFSRSSEMHSNSFKFLWRNYSKTESELILPMLCLEIFLEGGKYRPDVQPLGRYPPCPPCEGPDNPSMVVSINKDPHTHLLIMKPGCVSDHKVNMRLVDKSEALISSINCAHTAVKFP